METREPGADLARLLLAVDLSELDADGARVWVAASQRLERFVEARRYEVAAHYADLHPPQPEIGPQQVGAERAVAPGADGTPAMEEFAVTELAVAARCSTARSWGMIGDGLDLRHRMPRLFEQLRCGAVDGFKVRMILRRTHSLRLQVARMVDRRIAPVAARIGPRRLDAEIDRALIELDADGAAQRARGARATRRVGLGPAGDGDRQFFGYVDAMDGLAFDAALDRVADILGDLGDADPKAVRRATAVGWLANPPATLALIERHRAWTRGETPAPWAQIIVADRAAPRGSEPTASDYAAVHAAAAAGTDADGFARSDAPGAPASGTHPICDPGCGRSTRQLLRTGSPQTCGPSPP